MDLKHSKTMKLNNSLLSAVHFGVTPSMGKKTRNNLNFGL